jgi:lipocalin
MAVAARWKAGPGSPVPSDEGALEVTFVSLLGFWLWPLSGDYIVFAIDPEYRWTAIGHPSRGYGWILAREETLAPDVLKSVASRFETGRIRHLRPRDVRPGGGRHAHGAL